MICRWNMTRLFVENVPRNTEVWDCGNLSVPWYSCTRVPRCIVVHWSAIHFSSVVYTSRVWFCSSRVVLERCVISEPLHSLSFSSLQLSRSNTAAFFDLLSDGIVKLLTEDFKNTWTHFLCRARGPGVLNVICLSMPEIPSSTRRVHSSCVSTVSLLSVRDVIRWYLHTQNSVCSSADKMSKWKMSAALDTLYSHRKKSLAMHWW